ncbi:MAG: tRNA (adenosine(37)-N6)-threonylcarbamoyltransferase complex transferase subunit TsaD [Mariprofundaceae bacterium]|nr:tRNA (adenosine(37)-N6)-threonylcarbamoyltransferase complex transferase subunit TsaD [Mariprofundaceae bacterium]
MRILAIETSCDETGVAIYQQDNHQGHVLSNHLSSQIAIHARFGGVVPEIASREHDKTLPPMLAEVMRSAALSWSDIDALAVTSGPGLMGALLVGTSFARAMAMVHQLPLMPIHHLEGHILAAGLSDKLPPMPFVALLVSGGHTLLVLVKKIGNYQLLGQTLDDAAGECFDKSARLLGLPYPGGPEIALLAKEGVCGKYRLPRPMLHRDGCDFSFSGLKTAVLHASKKINMHDHQQRCDLAAEIQSAICDVLIKKTMRACTEQGVAHVVLAGGVAANTCLRDGLAKAAAFIGIQSHVPPAHYCTDNAAMIAYAAHCRFSLGESAPAIDTWDANPRQRLIE